jgi:glycosyltransferase involved in cell wall biosynthesis
LVEWLQQNGDYVDYVWSARPDVTVKILKSIRQLTKAKLLYYTHGLNYLRERRRYELKGDPGALMESERLKNSEVGIFRQVDCVMTPCGNEARVIREEVPSADVSEIVPYFFPPEEITEPLDFTSRAALIFVGGFDHLPNVDAAVWLVREILPLVLRRVPACRLLIVGSNPCEEVRALQSERVDVVGYAPDLAPYYQRSRVSVNPLRYSTGVKGKIVASLNAGVPVVTTSVGNEGIELLNGVEALVADSAGDIAAAVISLFLDDRKCQLLAESGKSVIRRRFSMMKARRTIECILKSEACVYCGAPVAESPDIPRGASWYQETGCTSCRASNLALMVATVALEPLRARGLNTISAAADVLSQLHVFDSGLFSFIAPVTGSVGIVSGGYSPADLTDRRLQALTLESLASLELGNAGLKYDLLIAPSWNSPADFRFEEIDDFTNNLKPAGRLLSTTLDIRGVQAAWRSRLATIASSHPNARETLKMVIYEIAPANLDPYVSVIELKND